MARQSTSDLRRRVYLALEQGPVGGGIGVWVDRFLVLLILINLASVVLESVPSNLERYASVFNAIEYFSLVVFTLEYAFRIWSAVEHGPHRELPSLHARLKYIFSPPGMVDLFAVLPFWLTLALPPDFRFLLVFRMMRFFKVARYSPAMRSLLEVLYRERRALFGCLAWRAARLWCSPR